MNKIIPLSGKDELPKGAFDFACMLNEHEPVLLTGVFLPKVDYWNSLLVYSYAMAVPTAYFPEPNEVVVEDAIPQFERLCQLNGVDYRVHDKEYDDIRKEMRTETRFADLLVFSNDAFAGRQGEIVFDDYAEDAMHGAECPVVIVPEDFKTPESIILAYDGSASSAYAIRQFAALMPGLAKLETLLVFVGPDGKEMPDKPYLEELAARHFPNLTFMNLDIDPRKYFTTWLSERKNTMLVTGSGGRSGFSEIFRKSFIHDIVSEQMLPVFLAHR